MFIVWGTKIDRKVVGRRADWCFLCRGFQPATLIRVKAVGHLYYIPTSSGRVIGYEQHCETCKLPLAADNLGEYPVVSKDKHADLQTLLDETNPQAKTQWAQHIAWEEALRAGEGTLSDRMQSITDMFVLANDLVEARTIGWYFDQLSGAGCLLTFVGYIAVAWLASSIFQIKVQDTNEIAMPVALALAALTLLRLITDGRRYVNNTVLPILVRAIRPLKPTDEELTMISTYLKSNDVKIVTYLKVQTISDALKQTAD